MSDVLGFQSHALPQRAADRVEHVITQHPLRRVLAFTGRSIDEVINSPVARNHVREYFKLTKWIARRSEIVELEDQWNSVRNSRRV